MHSFLMAVSLVVAFTAEADQGLQPWASNRHPSDAAKSHVEEVTAAQQQYSIVQGGTMDGENCRSPVSCGMAGEGAWNKPGNRTGRCAWRTSDRPT